MDLVCQKDTSYQRKDKQRNIVPQVLEDAPPQVKGQPSQGAPRSQALLLDCKQICI